MASTAVCLRRPNALRFTPHMEKCLSCLESSPYAAPTDKVMAGFVKIQRIAEEAQSTLRLDEPEMAADLADTRVQLTLKGYKKQLDSWKENTAPDILRGTLQICCTSSFDGLTCNRHLTGSLPIMSYTTPRSRDAQRP